MPCLRTVLPLMLISVVLVKPSVAQSPAPTTSTVPPTPAAAGPSLDAALEAAKAALKTCRALSQKVAVTVVDSAGIIKAVLAEDGAGPRGVLSSTNKAVTALTFKAPTGELEAQSAANPELAAKLSGSASFNTHAGGLPIRVGNEIVGAIGVGGAKGSEKDEACAGAGLKKISAKSIVSVSK